MSKYIFALLVLFQINTALGQVLPIQTQADATIGIDRKNWNGGSTAIHSEGYAHDFTLPNSPSPCAKIVGFQVIINILSYTPNPPVGCTPGNVYFNIYSGCSTYSGGATCVPNPNLILEPNYNPSSILGSRTFNIVCPHNSNGLMSDFGDNFSVDIVPLMTPGCNPLWQQAITQGFLAYTYTISVEVLVSNISCSGTGCLAPTYVNLPCDDLNPCTTGETVSVLACDNSIVCIPCSGGTAVSDPGNCNDGICSNGVETWNAATCQCDPGTPPVPCVDDGICANGFEVWNATTCNCIITPPVSGCTNINSCNFNPLATCDDGSCISNADPGTCNSNCLLGNVEIWNPTTCMCEVAIVSVIGCTDPNSCNFNPLATCDDGTCISNADPGTCNTDCFSGDVEVWNPTTCQCEISVISVIGCTDPNSCNYNPFATCDDGSCIPNTDPGTCNTNCLLGDIEIWNPTTCACEISVISVIGCTDPNSCNYNPFATCDDGSCISNTDPGTCDDGNCANGIEFWNPTTCNCDPGTPPTPCTDDGDCTNGFEVWDAITCICNVTPPVIGCTNPTANNYDPLATCDDGSCTFACPDPGNCNDGICSNGVETWNGATCNCDPGTPVTDPGTCNDGICSNGVETWNATTCACEPGTPPTPCTDDGDCTNGFEVWNSTTCNCDITPPVSGCTDPAANNYDPLATCDNGSCTFDCPDPGTCNDGICSNGVETWNPVTCACDPGTPPTPCTDDGDCTNGFEVWNIATCNCDITPPVSGCTNPAANNYNPLATCDNGSCTFDCPDPGNCSDGICSNGLETWNPTTCTCDPGIPVTDPGCDDGNCANGVETWNTATCMCDPGTPPTPCTNDGDCTNGFEVWNTATCNCDITPPVSGCTNPTANNYNPLATCDNGSCTFDCPDPGNCNDGICSNGVETWNGTTCMCDPGTAVTDPGCDDGNCANGIEIWNTATCMCESGTPPTPCTDDGDCTNGFEMWNTATCNCDITPPILGCTNPAANNYNPLATCDDNSCTFGCPDPGNCNDGDCANGVETWNPTTCACEPGVAPNCSDTDCQVTLPCDDLDECTYEDSMVMAPDGSICMPCAGIPIECNDVDAVVTQPCDDNNPLTENDMETVLLCDGSICSPCQGTQITFTKSGFTPNIFSPNGDGVNDNFMIFIGPDIKVVYKFEIFDRWGSKMFSRSNFSDNDPLNAWDGAVNGKKANIGVYLYYAQVEYIDGTVEILKGNITIIE